MLLALAVACHPKPPESTRDSPSDSPVPSPAHADVLAVSATGDPAATVVSMTLRSDDVDCTQYADWWELVADDGTLVYRRILDHSHPDEQPFTRSGDPVALDGSQPLWARAHLHPDGYGGAVLHGTVDGGFVAATAADGFAAALETADPLPPECLF